ncbi:MAG TPA: alpha/beta hydrolase [Anaerolineales bacterium]|nr:alpha/beta hydrolase [Anaerolineales bacterium]
MDLFAGKSKKSFSKTVVNLVGGALAAAGGWIVYSKTSIDHDLPLPLAITAERAVYYSQQAGRVSYYHDRAKAGVPLLLVHSVNAAASAFEMKPLFEHFRQFRSVFAVDLPGYGFSERSDRVYSPQLFETALLDLMANLDAGPFDVVALSLGSEFAARAALARPDLFRSLALISPSGLKAAGSGKASQQAGDRGYADSVYEALSAPLWGRPLFDLITTRKSIQYFLSQSFVGTVPTELIDYSYQTSHQPGAEHAPLYFLSGQLFTPDVRGRVYQNLGTPGLVLYDRDNYVSFDRLPELLRANPHWQAVRIAPTLGLPHWEKLSATVEALEAFWKTLGE